MRAPAAAASRPRRRPRQQFAEWYELRGRGAAGGRDDARDGRGRRRPRRADGPAEGARTRWLPLLHELRERQGGRDRRRPAGGAGRLLARARPPGAGARRARAAGEADSDAYFASRPRGSRLGAWASPQSRPLADRAELEEMLRGGRGALRGRREVPGRRALGRLPLRPATIEFWQGQRARLHDRFLYTSMRPAGRSSGSPPEQLHRRWADLPLTWSGFRPVGGVPDQATAASWTSRAIWTRLSTSSFSSSLETWALTVATLR